MNQTVVEVKDLVKTYGSIRAVDGISISVARGEVFDAGAERYREDHHHADKK